MILCIDDIDIHYIDSMETDVGYINVDTRIQRYK